MTRRRDLGDGLTDRPDHALVGVIRMPTGGSGPLRSIIRRVVYALITLAAAVLIV